MTMMQIRNVPDDVHRKLKARAALAGMSLSEYALRELERVAAAPTRAELIERLTTAPRRTLRPSPTELVRRERDTRAGR
jgi:antitoxin FitA